MVDVAFNLVLFFMVTATTVLYKTLEIPKPSGEAPAAAVAQGRSRSLDDLKDDYILVEIDDSGAMKLDREPIAPVMETLVEQLRRAREKTGPQDHAPLRGLHHPPPQRRAGLRRRQRDRPGDRHRQAASPPGTRPDPPRRIGRGTQAGVRQAQAPPRCAVLTACLSAVRPV